MKRREALISKIFTYNKIFFRRGKIIVLDLPLLGEFVKSLVVN